MITGLVHSQPIKIPASLSRSGGGQEIGECSILSFQFFFSCDKCAILSGDSCAILIGLKFEIVVLYFRSGSPPISIGLKVV